MSLSKEELERYSRQMALREIGVNGQRKLKDARVCIVGVGGLGCISALQLVATGVGYIRLVDQDVVDLTNLHRQFLYDTSSLGYPKVEVAEKKLKSLNPNVEVEPMPLTINSNTAHGIVEGVDVVIDGLDRFSSRYAINEACVKLRVPYVFGGAIEAYGNVSTIIPGETACLECLIGRVSDDELPTCEIVGVLPSVLGVVASIQVREAISLILGRKPSLANKLLHCDLNSTNFELFSVGKLPFCLMCGMSMTSRIAGPRVAKLCGKNSFMISPRSQTILNMPRVSSKLKSKYRMKVQAHFGVTFDYSDEVSISLMKTGNMLVKGVSYREDALRIYGEIMDFLSKS